MRKATPRWANQILEMAYEEFMYTSTMTESNAFGNSDSTFL